MDTLLNIHDEFALDLLFLLSDQWEEEYKLQEELNRERGNIRIEKAPKELLHDISETLPFPEPDEQPYFTRRNLSAPSL